ncbi:amidohydrolase family protein [Thalassotalea sediminis]|uniref:amidohydrolase family protein n=1 Tax=Thalassotalea sediminis TaxID=1759089 RepID=UPI00257221BF|nr:amidohydrolase family protein [Thalassotalea sediminis]
MTIKVIDPHIHLFDLTAGDYHWLKPENPPFWQDKALIYRSFSCRDICLDSPLSLNGVVHIEAGFDNQNPQREIEYLQRSVKLPFSSVALADITLAPDLFAQAIEGLLTHNTVVGVRYILDEQALAILSLSHVQVNLELLAHKGLVFDCQMPIANKKAVSKLCEILTLVPTLKVVINHAGSPHELDKAADDNHWYQGLKMLSVFPTVAIKCSGWEMISRSYSVTLLREMTLTCVDVFGLERVMLASNFPLCLFSQPYQTYWQIVVDAIPNSLLDNLCYLNAKKWYNVG